MVANTSFPRWIRFGSAAVLAALLASAACADRVTGPGTPRLIEGMRPTYLLDGAPAPLPVGSVRIRLASALGTALLDTVLTFPADGSDITLTAAVQVAPGVTEVRAAAEFLNTNGATLFRSDAITVRVQFQGQPNAPTPEPVPLPLTYVGPGAGTTLAVTANAPTTTGFVGDTLPLRAEVRDAQGTLRPEVPVVWTSLDTLLARMTNATDGRVVLGSLSGGGRGAVRLVASTYTGARDTVELRVQPLPSRIVGPGGDTLRATVATAAAPLLVKVFGADSLPVRDAEVTFEAVGVTLDTAVARTDTTGVARVAVRVPQVAGSYGVIARPRRGSGSVGITVVARPDTAVRLRLTPALPDSVAVGALLPRLEVAALDAYGNVATTYSDTVSVWTTGSGTILVPANASLTRSAVAGIARYDSLRMTRVETGVRLFAQAPRLRADTSRAFTVFSSAPTRTVFVTQPPDTLVAGDTLPALQVETRDNFDNALSAKDSVRLVLISDSTGAVLSGITVRRDSAGRAVFPGVKLTKAGGPYRLVARSDTLRADTSRAFRVKAGAPNGLVITRAPQAERVAGDRVDTMRVELQDAHGNRVLTAQDTVTVSLFDSIGGAAFYGGTKRALQNGVATFSEIVIGLPGPGFALNATVGSFSVATARFRMLAANPRRPRDVLAAGSAVCALRTDNETMCWGRGYNTWSYTSRPGDGSTIGDSTQTEGHGIPRRVLGGQAFVSLAAGIQATCGLTGSGAAYCWGATAAQSSPQTIDNRLGIGAGLRAFTPQLVQGGLTFRHLSVGGFAASGAFICGVTTSDVGYCWGRDTLGRAGIGSSTASTITTPQQVSGGLSFAVIRTAPDFACGLTTTGLAYCWGSNSNGQLGNGTTTNSSAPTAVSGGLSFVDISAGPRAACGLTARGDAFCWGSNESGAIGNGSTGGNQLTPVQVTGGLTFKRISAGSASACGITDTGAAYCWGNESYLGSGRAGGSSTPRLVSGGYTFAELAQGQDLIRCGVTTAGAVYCWGSNALKRVGDGFDGLGLSQVPSISATSLGGGRNNTCALSTEGVRCWGDNRTGALGVGAIDANPTFRTSPQLVNTSLTFRVIESSNGENTCGITTDSLAYCWGRATGNGDTLWKSTPTQLSGNRKWIKLAVGELHSCGIASDRKAYCWGQGTNGELGRGVTTTDTSTVPVAVSDTTANGLRWRDIAVGDRSTCAVDSLTTGLYCWGWDNLGVRGDPGTANVQATPLYIGAGYTNVVLNRTSTACALKTDGTVACWGAGALTGTNSNVTSITTPTTISGSYTFVELKAGFQETCGRTSTGAVYCWGANYNGQLGNGSSVDALVPVLVQGGHSFTSIHLGGGFGCGRTTAGSVYCWGRDFLGNRGLGNSEFVYTPSLVVGGHTFRSTPP